jgi:exopolysaccharide biosynthesis WecB/TagA/CpsF family protein
MRHDSQLPMVELLGLEFADLDTPCAVSLLTARPAGAPFGYVVTPNADHLVRLTRQPGLGPLYRGAMLRLLDSRVVAGAARLLGLPCPRVAPGSDLTAELLRHLPPGERVTIVGLDPAHLPALVRHCRLAPPAHYNPPMGFDGNPEEFRKAVRFVLDHPARFTLIAVGSPRQEKLAAAIRATGQATGTGLCIGASLEFLAGVIPRAPRWMQRAGVEWLHRMASDPRRLARRYLRDNPPVFALLLRERLRSRSTA